MLQNPSADIAKTLHQIAVMQMLVAVADVVIALFLLGGLAAGVFLLLKLNSAARKANAVVGAAKARADAVVRTFDEAHNQVKLGLEEAKLRTQELGAVLRIVQEELQSVLLDTAATARGVHTTAQRLREEAPPAALTPHEPVDAPAEQPRLGRAASGPHDAR